MSWRQSLRLASHPIASTSAYLLSADENQSETQFLPSKNSSWYRWYGCSQENCSTRHWAVQVVQALCSKSSLMQGNGSACEAFRDCLQIAHYLRLSSCDVILHSNRCHRSQLFKSSKSQCSWGCYCSTALDSCWSQERNSSSKETSDAGLSTWLSSAS